MKVKNQIISEIASGTRSAILHRVKSGEEAVTAPHNETVILKVHNAKSGWTRYEVNKPEAVQPSDNTPSLGKVSVTGITRVNVRALSYGALQRLGYNSNMRLLFDWTRSNDPVGAGRLERAVWQANADPSLAGRLSNAGMIVAPRPASHYDAWLVDFDNYDGESFDPPPADLVPIEEVQRQFQDVLYDKPDALGDDIQGIDFQGMLPPGALLITATYSVGEGEQSLDIVEGVKSHLKSKPKEGVRLVADFNTDEIGILVTPPAEDTGAII